MILYLRDDIKAYFNTATSLFDQMMALSGECFRQQKNRLTQRIVLGDKTYFIKQYRDEGWKEIIKNLLQLKLPVISAKNEWQAIHQLQKLNVSVPDVVAFGQRGINPAQLESFVLLEDLTPTVSLETLCRDWNKTKPAFAFKRLLIEEVARIARALHQNGINHRDFYICHFLLNTYDGLTAINANNLQLYLIDLHRAQMRRVTPLRWVIKDLTGLYFSSKDIGLTQRDLYRFMRIYRHQSLKTIMRSEKNFWQKVTARGEQLYRDLSK